MTTTRLLVPAETEPVSLGEAKLAARIDSDAFDQVLPSLIGAAREMAEHRTGRLFAAQTWRVELRDWPASSDVLQVRDPTALAITYWNGAAWSTLSNSGYAWAAVEGGTAVVPATGGSWPTLAPLAIGPRVRIDITAGLEPEAVPGAVKLYIKAMVAHWIDNPAAAGGKLEANPFLESMLDTQKVYA